MQENDLNRAVADATGETVDHIKKIGFTLVVVPVLSRSRRRQSCTNRPTATRPSAAVSIPIPNHTKMKGR
jgi:hypothetical protein